MMLGVHVGRGSLLFRVNSLRENGWPGKNPFAFRPPPSTASVSHLQRSDGKPHTRNRFSHAERPTGERSTAVEKAHGD